MNEAANPHVKVVVGEILSENFKLNRILYIILGLACKFILQSVLFFIKKKLYIYYNPKALFNHNRTFEILCSITQYTN